MSSALIRSHAETEGSSCKPLCLFRGAGIRYDAAPRAFSDNAECHTFLHPHLSHSTNEFWDTLRVYTVNKRFAFSCQAVNIRSLSEVNKQQWKCKGKPMGMTRKSSHFCFKTSQMGLFWLILPGLVGVLFFLKGWGSNWHVSFDQIWEDQFMLRSLPAAVFHQQREMKGGLFSQPLDLRGCNHMAITPSWRAPFISPSHLWLPAPGFISPATDWWNSAAFVQCNPAYAYVSGHQLWILVKCTSASGWWHGLKHLE